MDSENTSCQTVDPVTAAKEFDRMLEAFGLELDIGVDSLLDQEQVGTLRVAAGRVKRMIEKGHVVIEADGRPTFYPQRCDVQPFTFDEMEGNAAQAAERYGENQSVTKMFAIAASMTGKNPGVFAKLKGSDFKAFQYIITLFVM